MIEGTARGPQSSRTVPRGRAGRALAEPNRDAAGLGASPHRLLSSAAIKWLCSTSTWRQPCRQRRQKPQEHARGQHDDAALAADPRPNQVRPTEYEQRRHRLPDQRLHVLGLHVRLGKHPSVDSVGCDLAAMRLGFNREDAAGPDEDAVDVAAAGLERAARSRRRRPTTPGVTTLHMWLRRALRLWTANHWDHLLACSAVVRTTSM
jgi:hypothetical protein